jgi:uncharacterized protein
MKGSSFTRIGGIYVKYTTLGRTGLCVSRTGVGGIPLTRRSEDDAAQIVRRALELGITIFDTAYGYRGSEERIGKGLKGARSGVVIATKTPARDRTTALQHLDESLRRLGTDYVDIWQSHNLTRQADFDRALLPGGAVEFLEEAKRAGKVRFVGMSSHNVDTARQAILCGRFDVVQYQFNFISREAARHLVPLAKQHDVGFLGMKPFAGGTIGSAALAIKYLLQFENVVPVPGIETMEEIEEIAAIVEADERFSTEERAALDEIHRTTNDRFCRQCEYCMPCPQGVMIPALMYTPRLWGLWSRERILSWPYVMESVKSLENCTRCGMCESKCPYNLPVRDMLVECAEFHRRAMLSGGEISNKQAR